MFLKRSNLHKRATTGLSDQSANDRNAETNGHGNTSSQQLAQQCKLLHSATTHPAPHERFQVRAHNGKVNAVLGTPDGKYVISAGEDNELGIICSHSKALVRKLTGHTRKVTSIALLDDDTVVSVSVDRTARVWSISQRRELRRILLPFPASVVVSLNDGRFAVGMRAGYLSIHARSPGEASLEVGHFKTHDNAWEKYSDVVDLCVTKRYLVTVSLDGTLSYWDLNSFRLCNRQKLVQQNTFRSWEIRSLSQCDHLIAVSFGSHQNSKGTIKVFKEGTLRAQQQIKKTLPVTNSVHFVGASHNVLYLSMKDLHYSVHLHDLFAQSEVWSAAFTFSETAEGQSEIDSKVSAVNQIECFNYCSHGRFLFGLKNGMVDVILTPPEVVPVLNKGNSEREVGSTIVSNPLFKALCAYEKEGYLSVQSVVGLICYKNCAMSFREWNSAHTLLEHEVEEGRIPGQTSYEHEHNYWFQNLYMALKDLNIASREELKIAVDCLNRAKQLGLIEGSEAAIAAYHCSKAALDKIEALHSNHTALDERINIRVGKVILRLQAEIKVEDAKKVREVVTDVARAPADL